MRILRLEGRGDTPAVELHPGVSVVATSSDDSEALRMALEAIAHGRDPGCGGLMEAHGVVMSVDADLLARLELTPSVSTVVTADDLSLGGADADASLEALTRGEKAGESASASGVGPAAEDSPADGVTSSRAEIEALRASQEALRVAADELRARRLELENERQESVAALEEARLALDPYASTALEMAHALQESPAEHDHTDDEAREQRAVLQSELAAVEDEINQLAPEDPVDVREALEHIEEAGGGESRRGAEARRLAAELEEIGGQLEALAEARRGAGLDPDQVRRELQTARLQLERVEAEQVVADVDPDVLAELEAAHDEVVEAEAKLNSLKIGRKAQRERLEELIAVEQEILDRTPFRTYAACALHQSAPGMDAEARVAHEATRAEVDRLDAQLTVALDAAAHDATRSGIEAHLEELRREARGLVTGEVDDLLAELNRLADAHPPATVTELRGLLEQKGMALAELDLDDADVLDLARALLQEYDQDAQRRAELELRRSELYSDLAVLAAPEDEDGPEPVDVEAAADRLARHEAAEQEVDRLNAQLDAIEDEFDTLDARLEAQDAVAASVRERLERSERDGASSGDTVPAPATEPASRTAPTAPAFGPADDEDDQAGLGDPGWQLLSRASELQRVSFAGSVPLLLDHTFEALEPDRLTEVLGELVELSELLQVVYFGQRPEIVEWARDLGEEFAAVVGSEPSETATTDQHEAALVA